MAKDLTEEKAFEIEKYYIEKIGRKSIGTGPLLNLTPGGDGGDILDKESREKHKKSQQRRWKVKTKDEKNEFVKNSLGNYYNDPDKEQERKEMYKRRGESLRETLRLKKEKGLKISYPGMKGRKHTEETKKKISETKKLKYYKE